MSAHLKALGADFLAFLHPGDSGFGLPGGLAHKRRNSTRDACLVLWGFDETWQAFRKTEQKRVQRETESDKKGGVEEVMDRERGRWAREKESRREGEK